MKAAADTCRCQALPLVQEAAEARQSGAITGLTKNMWKAWRIQGKDVVRKCIITEFYIANNMTFTTDSTVSRDRKYLALRRPVGLLQAPYLLMFL